MPGLRLAQAAYGSVAERELALVLAKVEGDRKYAAGCVTALGIEDRRTLRQGLVELRALARRR